MKPYAPLPTWTAFALAYVFPNGELLTITRTLEHLAKTGFEIRDVEDLDDPFALRDPPDRRAGFGSRRSPLASPFVKFHMAP